MHAFEKGVCSHSRTSSTHTFGPGPSHRGGGHNFAPRRLHRANYLKFLFANCTSLMAHWQSLFCDNTEITCLVETRVNAREQAMLTSKLRSRSFTSCWSAPSPTSAANGMLGKSGGVLIATSDDWRLDKMDNHLELETSNTNYLLVHATNDIRKESIYLVVYYGHPDHKMRTVRDLRRIQEWMVCVRTPTYVLGDWNLTTQADMHLDPAIMLDVAWKWAEEGRGALCPTYYGTETAERLDRVYIPAWAWSCVENFAVDDTIPIPSHRALQLTLTRRTISLLQQRPLPRLQLDKVCAQYEERAQVATIRDKWDKALSENKDIDALLSLWTQSWEQYLVGKYVQSRPNLKSKMQATPYHKVSYHPLRPCPHRRLAELANYVKHLEILACPSSPSHHLKQKWDWVAKRTPAMTRAYGVPRSAWPEYIMGTCICVWHELRLSTTEAPSWPSTRSSCMTRGGPSNAD